MCQGSYIVTGALSELESLYAHVNQGVGILFKTWFPTKSAFKNYKPAAKTLSKFKRLDLYVNPIGAILEDSEAVQPPTTQDDRLNGASPDNRIKIKTTGKKQDGTVPVPQVRDAILQPSNNDSHSLKNRRKKRKLSDDSTLTKLVNDLVK